MSASVHKRLIRPPPIGEDVQPTGTHEYGLRTYSRTLPGCNEVWIVRPNDTIALYGFYGGGRLLASYRHKPGRISA